MNVSNNNGKPRKEQENKQQNVKIYENWEKKIIRKSTQNKKKEIN